MYVEYGSRVVIMIKSMTQNLSSEHFRWSCLLTDRLSIMDANKARGNVTVQPQIEVHTPLKS